MKHFDTALRVIIALLLIGGYIVMAVSRDLFLIQTAYWKRLMAVCGLVFYIVALGAILISHRNSARPLWELPLAFMAPYLLYAILFLSFDPSSKELWRFTGAFQFISISGGFFLGIVLSPLIAVAIGSYTGREALDFTVLGFRFIDRIGLRAFGIVLGAGLLTALMYVTWLLVAEIREISIMKKIFFFLVLLGNTSLFAYYSYTLTRFGAGVKM
ncbi:MAG: hypothetical protein KA369_01105 [Spirochaetes bacterium]|nr:hypothetical protein [Spirochaetota bacterium]